ncbi:Protein N-terminal asparagine amidohydrolase [Trichoplax sp. H2]|nr:Protein N-terminal asparagine amidohydrolase [Trichoplax sp. H2]|eukprot:RDD37066.1 Protein N-terminal asparagine amidohydrolase [Trichoplax sp. H2]
MPLFFQSRPIEITPDANTLNGFKEEFKKSSQYLIDSGKRNFHSGKVLYVAQREYAVVQFSDDNVQIMGSEDATTCHIVIIRHTGCGTTALGHFDGTNVGDSLNRMIATIQVYADKSNISGRLEIHIIGGFKDSKGLSLQLSLEIIGALASSAFDLHLVTPCFGEINDTVRDDGEHMPIIYGAGIDIQSGVISWASFSDKGPDEIIRHSRLSWGYCNKMTNLYDTATCEVHIKPFAYRQYRKEMYVYYLRMSDQEFLKNMSTSPKVEPSYFVDKAKEILLFMLSSPRSDTLFPNGIPRRYRCHQGKWIRIVNS